MQLSTILELCEEHMSEGDYLQASNILKNIHNNTTDEENEPEEMGLYIPTDYDIYEYADCQIKIDDNTANNDIVFQIHQIEKYRRDQQIASIGDQIVKVAYSIKENNVETPADLCCFIKLRKLFKFHLLKLQSTSIRYSNGRYDHIFTFKKYLSFYSKLVKDNTATGLVDNDDVLCFDLEEYYEKFISYIIDTICEFLQIEFEH
jgi:hypothetical protein